MHDVSAVPTPLPRLHAAIAPIQGRIRTVPEDFRVEEIPAYEPSGAGEHLFVHLEKRGRGTPEVVRDLERALGLERRAGSWAGLKDRWAVTRQWISLLGADPEALASVSIEGVTLLGSCRHGKKLKAGHLRGNRFTLRVRGLPADRLEDAAQILDGLVRDGLPNYFGAQRFGRDRDNASRARAWLIGGGRAPRDSFKRRLWVSSLQSELFNEWLGSRIRGGFTRALPGDLMRKEETGGLFIAEQMPIEQARMDRLEIDPTGPIFGPKMRWPEGEARALEEAILAQGEIDEAVLQRIGRLGPGSRRPMRVRPTEARIEAEPDGATLYFTLPKGSYATVLLDEIFKEGLEDRGGQDAPIGADAGES